MLGSSSNNKSKSKKYETIVEHELWLDCQPVKIRVLKDSNGKYLYQMNYFQKGSDQIATISTSDVRFDTKEEAAVHAVRQISYYYNENK